MEILRTSLVNNHLVCLELLRKIHGQFIRKAYCTRRIRYNRTLDRVFVKVNKESWLLTAKYNTNEIKQEALLDNSDNIFSQLG